MHDVMRRGAALAGTVACLAGAIAPAAARAAGAEELVQVGKLSNNTGTGVNPAAIFGGLNVNQGAGGQFGVQVGSKFETETFTFTPPAATSLVRADIWPSIRLYGWPAMGTYTSATSSWGSWNINGSPGDVSVNQLYGSGGSPLTSTAGSLSATVTMNSSGAGSEQPGWFLTDRAVLTLADNTDPAFDEAPSPTAIFGTPNASGWYTGDTAQLTATVRDAGTGVRYLLVKDGTAVHRYAVVPSSSTCRTADASLANPNNYTVSVPCPTASARYTVPVDLAELGDGSHDLRLGIQDGAGNQTYDTQHYVTRTNAPEGSLGDPGTTGPGGCTYEDDGSCTAPPANAAVPTITGTAQVGKTLSTTSGTWTNASGATYVIQWQRSSTSVGYADIPGATSSTYKITSDDVGRQLRSRVTATTAGGASSAASTPTAAVVEAPEPTTSGGSNGETPSSGGGGGSGGGGSAGGDERACAGHAATGGACAPNDSNRAVVQTPPASQAAPARGAWIGRNATDHARLKVVFDQSKRDSLRSRFGKRTSFTGRLVNADNGKPIGDAAIRITGIRTAKPSTDHLAVTTSADGSFHAELPRGLTSQTLRVAYLSHERDTEPVAAETLVLKVRAAAKLRVSPKRVRAHGRRRSRRRMLRNGDRITFRGRVVTEPIPVGGKTIILEAKVRGLKGWRQFKTMKTGRDGRFRYRYQLHDTVGRVKYTFRAVVPAVEGSGIDYPYEDGRSARTHIWVRGR